MRIVTLLTTAIGAVGMLAVAAPAAAVVTTFASYNAISGGNIYFLNNGTGGNNQNYRSNGFGGTIATTNSAFNVRPASAVPGAVAVTFSFLSNPTLASISNVNALFTLNATVANSPALTLAGFKIETGLSGSFSFLSTADITINDVLFESGSNLLSGTFTSASIFGTSGGTSGSFTGSTPTSTITYTSDFLTFGNTNDRDFALSLTAITSLANNINRGLNNATGRSLRSFRATSTGSFSSDPAPLLDPSLVIVPEPEIWAMLVVGFGLVGMQVRRRKPTVVAS